MLAGQLDQYITIQSVSYSKSATGEDVETYADVVSLWAAVRQRAGKGRERFAAGADRVERWFEVETRAYPGIKADMRVLWSSQLNGDLVLDIRSVEAAGDRAANVFLYCRVVE